MTEELFEEYKQHAQSITELTKQSFGEEVTTVSYFMIAEYIVPSMMKMAILTGQVGPDPEFILFATARHAHDKVEDKTSVEEITLTLVDMFQDEKTFQSILNEADELTKNIGFDM